MPSSDSIHDSHPKAIPPPQVASPPRDFRARANFVKEKLTTRRGWLGDYDYAWLCLPSLPFYKRSKRPPPFYALDAELPLTLAIFTGFQHALAMLAGLITPPIIFASALSLDSATSAYMISASLIGCGILSLVQLSRIPLFGGYYLGTGLISVVGTSFSTLSTANAIFDAMYRDGTCSSTTAADGTVTRDPCPDAYGKVLGTVILLIGASLVGSSGALNWGGGAGGCQNFPTSGIFQLCPTTLAPRPLPWGSPEFIGLGFLSFISIILTELFGSPFLKNISIIVGLAVGCIVSGAAGYIDGSSIKTAPVITFLWVHTFKIGVYAPAILPMLAVYVSLAMEATGDITASAEVSRLPVDGIEFDSRVQGGILVGAGHYFSVNDMSLTRKSQNNGVIAITRCANRSAGRWCCGFLIIFGILGKISGVFLAIPNSVLGGVTTFLFSSVAVSGLRVLSYAQFTRRDRFVLAAALSFGLADVLVPGIFTHLFDGVDNPSSGLEGLFNSITIILSTPFLAAGIVASLLNIILPREMEDVVSDDESQGVAEEEEHVGSSTGKVEV
ncbi:xanthine/uracil permease [Fomes fomentarius]|nr:xanthine/uracil permease [Fomes fomentarius]